MSKHAVRFFDAQFQRQAEAGEYKLNPFEDTALPFLSGDVLDLGCGLGNLAIAAARKGCRVTAIDGSPAAVEDLKRRAAEEGLAITPTCADIRGPKLDRTFDACVAIGLFMFFRRADAVAGLLSLIDCVRPGGILVVNVLIEGTTFLGMFDPDDHYLFGPTEVRDHLAGWSVEHDQTDRFPAPGDTVKRFTTVIARRPSD